MSDRGSRPPRSVGVYDRPHPLRRRKVLVPVAIAVVIVVAYALYFALR